MKRCYHQNELKSASTQHRTVEHSTAQHIKRIGEHQRTNTHCMRVFVYSIHTPKWQFKCMNMGSLFVCYAYLFIFSRLLPLVSFECVVVVVHVHVMTAKCFALSLLRLRVWLSFLILPFTAAHNKKSNKNLISIYHICMYICVQKKMHVFTFSIHWSIYKSRYKVQFGRLSKHCYNERPWAFCSLFEEKIKLSYMNLWSPPIKSKIYFNNNGICDWKHGNGWNDHKRKQKYAKIVTLRPIF